MSIESNKVIVNTECFQWWDAADIALQRTSTLKTLPVIGAFSEKAWFKGASWPLKVEARIRKDKILSLAINEIEKDFLEISPYLDGTIDNMVDIGCGHALIDIFFWKNYGCNIHLIDIERNDKSHFDYHDDAAAYASLKNAKKFLVNNGVEDNSVKTTNPLDEQLEVGKVDLFISLLSCGFHYPVETYLDLITENLSVGGQFICDIRKDTDQDIFIDKRFSDKKIIRDHNKYQRVCLIK